MYPPRPACRRFFLVSFVWDTCCRNWTQSKESSFGATADNFDCCSAVLVVCSGCPDTHARTCGCTRTRAYIAIVGVRGWRLWAGMCLPFASHPIPSHMSMPRQILSSLSTHGMGFLWDACLEKKRRNGWKRGWPRCGLASFSSKSVEGIPFERYRSEFRVLDLLCMSVRARHLPGFQVLPSHQVLVAQLFFNAYPCDTFYALAGCNSQRSTPSMAADFMLPNIAASHSNLPVRRQRLHGTDMLPRRLRVHQTG